MANHGSAPLFHRLPLLVLLSGASGVLMIAPAIVAVILGEWATVRAFTYASILTLILTGMVAIVVKDNPPVTRLHIKLLSLIGAFLVLPLVLALPLFESLGNTSFVNAYFEMVSSITTTGATVYEPARLNEAEHLWRGMVGWAGGLLIWSAALAIFAPLSLGGYELTVRSTGHVGIYDDLGMQRATSDRLVRAIALMVPPYLTLTLMLMVILLVAGDPPIVAAVHAMSTLSTSGISPLGAMDTTASGRIGEAAILLFFVFALSRATFARGVLGGQITQVSGLARDPELQLAAVIIAAIAIIVALHSGFGLSLTDQLAKLWGAVFTLTSFLTTTGFTSADWTSLRIPSEASATGLILMGLALIGGGVATTAGGLKLLRVYALLRHGKREVARLIHPSSVGGAGRDGRRLRREGAFIAWVVLMLLLLSMAVLVVALSLFSVGFEASFILTIASLTNTGPLIDHAAEFPIQIAAMPSAAKVGLALAMAVGRVETLALIALFNPQFWRA